VEGGAAKKREEAMPGVLGRPPPPPQGVAEAGPEAAAQAAGADGKSQVVIVEKA
jgi:hypothetical protein